MASAPIASQDEIGRQIVNAPSPFIHFVYGLPEQPRPRKDPTTQGGVALRIPVPGAAPDAGSVGLVNRLTKPVRRGDRLRVVLWARRADDVATARIANVGIASAEAPYPLLFGEDISVGHDWKLYAISGRSDADYAPGQLAARLDLATGRHVVDIGLIAVLDLDR
jgi:hypothetical protein